MTENSLSRRKYTKYFINTIDTYEEMVAFFKERGEAQYEEIAINKSLVFASP